MRWLAISRCLFALPFTKDSIQLINYSSNSSCLRVFVGY